MKKKEKVNQKDKKKKNNMQSQAKQTQLQESNMEIFIVKKNTCVDLECSICYKSINKSFARCSAPCSKPFHTTCMERMMEQTEITAYEENKDPEHKCCYCRRSIDINQYALQEMARRLTCLSYGGYSVGAALIHLKQNYDDKNDSSDISYDIYQICNLKYEKKPKQAKRSELKKMTKQPRIHIKQNSGRRRS